VDTGWVRLTRTCNNACLFCLDAENLDKQPIELEAIRAAIDEVADAGLPRVVFSGGEPTLSRHLLGAIKHAKARGLYTILTTNARIVQSDKVAQMLEAAGLDEIRVSVHAARRVNHEKLVQAEGAWVESVAALKYMGRTGVRVVMNTVLLRPNVPEVAYLMHLAMMAGMKEMRLLRLRPDGKGSSAVVKAELLVPVDQALAAIAELWFNAKEENVLFVAEGYEDTVDEGLIKELPPKQPDEAGLRLLRQRVQVHQLAHGATALDDEGFARGTSVLCEAHGGLRAVGHELAARFAPYIDLPACVGGRPKAEDLWGADAVYGPECPTCPVRPRCPGVPKKLAKAAAGQLAPLPAWAPAVGPVVVLPGGDDPLLDGETLPDLVAALRAEGLEATLGADPSALQAAGTVVCGSPSALAAALAARPEGQRIDVLDAQLGGGLEGATVVRSFAPGRLEALAGVPLDRVSWRPWPAPARCASLPPARAATEVLVLGATADWRLLQAAMGMITGSLPRVVALDGPDNPVPTVGSIRPAADGSDEVFLEHLARARFVVLPHRRGGDSLAERALLARDLRRVALAQAAGRPVVAVRGPGVEDGIRHDRTGWLVRPGQPAELADGMKRLFTDAALHGRLSDGARMHGALALPAAWARELARGATPDLDLVWATRARPQPRW
jgi:pyruvate-formate lyase-activating enzyme